MALLRSFVGIEGPAPTSSPSVLACGIGLAILALFFWRRKSGPNCVDMEGMPMKELGISGTSRAAILFEPYQVSKQGEQLAQDDPYIIRNGRHREVVLHTAEQVREFMRNDSKDHFKPPGLNFGDYFYRVLGQCVGTLNGQHWRAVRRYFDAAYTHDASLHMMPSFQKEVIKWLDALKNDTARAGADSLVVHVPTSCKTLPLRVIPQSFYGEAYDEDAYAEIVRISQLQRQALKYAITGRWQIYRWFNMLPTPSRRRLDVYHKEWEAFNLKMLETSRKKGLAVPAEHVFQGVQPDDAMSMDNYLQTIDEMIFTNIDITGSILAFMLGQLAKHPEFQQKLHEEIMAQEAKEGLGLRSYLTQSTSLLHYLCLESLRLQPGIWFSPPVCTSVDKVIGRYNVPAQTPIVIDVRRLNTNAGTWGPDSAHFQPDRFARLSPTEYRYGYMRFGVASGKCLGKHMADILMKVAIITVLKQYKIEEVEKTRGVKEGDLAFIQRR